MNRNDRISSSSFSHPVVYFTFSPQSCTDGAASIPLSSVPGLGVCRRLVQCETRNILVLVVVMVLDQHHFTSHILRTDIIPRHRISTLRCSELSLLLQWTSFAFTFLIDVMILNYMDLKS